MESTVDISAVSARDTSVHLLKPTVVSKGIDVSRLINGQYAIGIHEGRHYIIVDVTPDELRAFIDRLDALHRSAA